MPIKVPDQLPAKTILEKEHIFVMDESRAFHQDIRPIKIGILNLMPEKEATEVQLLRLLGNTPLQIETTLLHVKSHRAKNTSPEYLSAFYKTFDDIQGQKYDGFIVTGAPVELLPFEAVTYWEELKAILDWTKDNVTSTYHICWGAQAALYYHYGIEKYPLPEKMFGVFKHCICNPSIELFRGFDDVFYVPHSRHTQVRREDIENNPDLRVLAASERAGVYIAATKDFRQIYVTGHSEYDPNTLKTEYERDIAKGEAIAIPENYFENNNPETPPVVRWRSHASLLYNNWVNLIYQKTPYDINLIGNNSME